MYIPGKFFTPGHGKPQSFRTRTGCLSHSRANMKLYLLPNKKATAKHSAWILIFKKHFLDLKIELLHRNSPGSFFFFFTVGIKYYSKDELYEVKVFYLSGEMLIKIKLISLHSDCR